MKYKEKPPQTKFYLFERHVEALKKLSEFQEISMSNVLRNMIDKAVGYKKTRGLDNSEKI